MVVWRQGSFWMCLFGVWPSRVGRGTWSSQVVMPPQSAKSWSELSRVQEDGIQADSKKKKKEMTQTGCQSPDGGLQPGRGWTPSRCVAHTQGWWSCLCGKAWLWRQECQCLTTQKNKNKFKFVPDKRKKASRLYAPGARESHHVGVSSRRWTYTLQVAA